MLYDELYDIDRKISDMVNESMEEVTPDQVGLDRRAAYRLWVCEDAIAVRKDDDSRLQYYGGFEYVDKEFRKEYGDWVFYFSDDERVGEHLERYFEEEEA